MKKNAKIKKPLSRADIDEIVGDILMRATYLTMPIGGYDYNAGLTTELGMDSVDVMEVLIACDDTFGIDISDDDAEQVQTVGDLCDVVEKYLYPDGNPWN